METCRYLLKFIEIHGFKFKISNVKTQPRTTKGFWVAQYPLVVLGKISNPNLKSQIQSFNVKCQNPNDKT